MINDYFLKEFFIKEYQYRKLKEKHKLLIDVIDDPELTKAYNEYFEFTFLVFKDVKKYIKEKPKVKNEEDFNAEIIKLNFIMCELKELNEMTDEYLNLLDKNIDKFNENL